MSGWIKCSERLPEVELGENQEFIVCVYRKRQGKSYSFAAQYLNAMQLYNDCEDEEKLFTGWHDVKEHADYDGWYSPLELSDGDAVTHWQPLPPPPEQDK